MSTVQLTPRQEKGLQMVKDHKIKKIDGRKYQYSVEGSTGKTYLVRILPSDCSCPDFRLRQKERGKICYHVIACVIFEFNL